jgi:hypothetical protein
MDLNFRVYGQDIVAGHNAGTDVRSMEDGTSEYIAQQFQLTSDAQVDQISVGVAKNGTPTNDVYCAIYTDESTAPKEALTSADFSDFTSIAPASIKTTKFEWITFTLSSPVLLRQGVKYWIVIKSIGETAPDNFRLRESTAAGAYANGSVSYAADPIVSWTNVPAADLRFRVNSPSGAVNGMTMYQLSDESGDYRLIAFEGEIYKESASAFVPVSGWTRPLLARGQDARVRFSVGQDIARLTDGVIPSKVFYLRSSTEYFENEGLTAPTTAPTITPSAAGGTLTTGTYHIDYSYWNNDIVIPSNSWQAGVDSAGVNDAAVTGPTGSIALTNLPSGEELEGDRATHLRISVKGPGALIYRFQADVALGTTSYTITSLTLGAEMLQGHDVPPIHSLKRVAEGQQFIAGIDGDDTLVRFSKIEGTSSFYSSFPPFNFRRFTERDDDRVTGLEFIPPRSLIVGLKNSVRGVDARNPATSDRFTISKGKGIASQESQTVIGRRLFFISDARKEKGLHVWDGTGEPKQITGIDKTFKTLVASRIKYASCAHLAPGDGRFQWWIAVAGVGETKQDTIIIYDYELDAISLYRSLGNNIIATMESTANIGQIWIGRIDGLVRIADSGNDDASDQFNAYFTAKDNDYGAPDMIKRMRELRYDMDAFADGQLLVSMEVDCGDNPEERQAFSTSIDYAQSGDTVAAVWGSVNWGSFVYGSGGASGTTTGICRTVHGFEGRGRVFTPTFAGSQPWKLRMYSMGLQQEGEK